MNTLDAIVPPPPPMSPPAPPPPASPLPADAVERRRTRRWPFALAAVGLVVPAGLLVESVRGVPFYAFTPGDARPTEPRIQIKNTTSYDAKGDVLFVTVGVPRLTALAKWYAKDNPHDDVLPERAILGDLTPKENRTANVKLMGYSKDFATYVALKRLGYDVTLRGGGVVVADTCLGERNGGTCSAEGPAAKVLHPNDTILSIDGTVVHVAAEIPPLLAGKKAGDEITLAIRRPGESDPATETVELTTSPSDQGRVIIGFIPNDAPPADLTFSFPVDIGIDSGQVTGPSAGLAFTLSLIDKLTPGDLTGGVNVAATGTMSPSGNVGEIGGLRQKVVAVQRAGAKMFLVPKSEMQEALDEAKGSDLKVVGVSTLDEALEALAPLGGNAADYVKGT